MAVKTPNTREEEDNAYNPGELHAAEQFGVHDSIPGYDRSKDGLDDHPVSAGIADGQGDSDIDKTREEEETPNTIPYEEDSGSSQQPKSGRLSFNNLKLGGLKKKGPILSIILLVLGIGLGGSTLFGPALLIVQMKEVFSNYGGSASRAAPLRYEQRLIYMIGNKKVEAACNSNPSSTKCKRGTISEKDRKNYEKNGFKFNKSKDVNGRTIIREVEFPDGKKVKSGKAFNDYVKKNPSMASRAVAAHNPRTLIFNGGRFSKVVLKKFGLDKSKVTLAGEEDEDKKKAFDDKVKADTSESDADRERGFRAKYEEKIKGGAGKASAIAAVAGVACAAYNVSRLVVASVKLENSIRFVGFAMLFLKAADQIKDQGSVDPGTIATLGGILTSYATSGPKKGLTATDAQGYKVAAYGGEGALSSWSQNYLLGGSPQLKAIDNTLKWVTDKLGGRSTIKYACKAAGNFFTGAALSTAICGASAGEGAVAGTVVPVVGNAAGAIIGAAVCVVGSVAAGLVMGWAIGKAIQFAIPYAIKALKDAPIDANIAGVDAGNAMAVGAGVLLTTTSLSRGMKPANKADVKAFETATAGSQQQYDTIARYDAQKTPFDVYNQYSFLGSLVRSSGINYSQNGSLASNLQNIGTLMSSAIRVTPGAAALASMPLPIKDEDLSHCPDRDLVNIGVDCDRMGQMQLTLSDTELHMSDAANIEYMEGHDYVDDNGTVNEEKDYANFVKYCTEQREYLMGSSGEAIEDSNDWTTGKKCTENSTMLNNFRVYYFDQGDTEDSDYDTGAAPLAGGGSQLRVATYNVLGASHTDKSPGQDGYSPLPDWDERIVKVKDNIISNNIDVIGFQEFEPKQVKYIEDNLPGYERSTQGKESDSIMWNTSKFTKTDQGTWRIGYFCGKSCIDEPWVKLKDNSTGQEFYFMSHHDPVNNGKGSAAVRYDNALKHRDKTNELKADAPVILVGDFNNGYRKNDGSGMPSDEKTAYCVLSNAGMKNAIDAVRNQQFKCSGNPRPDKGSDIDSNIDHIYISEGLTVSKYFDINKPASGSDHVAVIADVVIPSKGEGEGGEIIGGPSKDGWVWPVPSVKTLGILGYGEKGSKGIHKGIDIGISGGGALGKPVVAAHDGVVNWVSTSDNNGCGSYISITATGTKYYAAYQHIDGSSIIVKKGDTVKAGQVIAKIGRQGGSTCGSSGFYHLHFSVESHPAMVSAYADPFPNGTINPLDVLPRPK